MYFYLDRDVVEVIFGLVADVFIVFVVIVPLDDTVALLVGGSM